MFRPISRLQSIQKSLWIARSARYCSGNPNNNLIGLDQDEIRKRINLRDQWSKSLDDSTSSSQFDFQHLNIDLSESTAQSRQRIENNSNPPPRRQSASVEERRFSKREEPLIPNEDYELSDEERLRSVGKQYHTPTAEFDPSAQKQPFWNERRSLADNDDAFPGAEPVREGRVRLNHPEALRLEIAQLKGNIQRCTDVTDLFDLIKPHLNRLNNSQIAATCDKLNSLYYEARRQKGEMVKYQKIVNSSPVFRAFMNHLNYSLVNLEANCLVSVLHTFSILHQDPSTQIVRNTVQLLKGLLSQVNLKDVTRCLFVLDTYMQHIPTRSKMLYSFNKELTLFAKHLVLTSQYEAHDIDAISRLYFIFLKTENDLDQAAIQHLTESLLNPEIRLTLRNSVKLLRRIKQNHIDFRAKKLKGEVDKDTDHKYRKNELYPKILGQLIEKCNSAIYEALYLEQSDDDLHFYFVNIHDCVDTLNFEFPHFYDERLTNFLVPYLLRVAEQKNYYKYFVYYLAQNYDKHLVYDEALLHFVYETYCSNEMFRAKVDFTQFYSFISKYRLPFIDHHRIASAAFDSNYFFHSSTKFGYNSLKVLSKFLLNDVTDEKFLINLANKVPCIEPRYLRSLSMREYKQFSVARSYLSVFDIVSNSSLKTKLDYSLGVAFRNIIELNRKPPITEMYFEIDSRLQRSGYLSDGLLFDAFGIYDKSTNSLLSLTKYTQYFNAIELIPLNENQEM